jgi:hypothetical protein
MAVFGSSFFLPFAVVAKEVSKPACLLMKGKPQKSQISAGQRRVLMAVERIRLAR